MKTNHSILSLLIVGLLLSLLTYCKRNEITDTKNELNAVTDVDGNVYRMVIIGTQVWMAENLKTTKFNDGTSIPYVTCSINAWENLKTPGYCWYDNNIVNRNIYGCLYNWYAINTGKLCPIGWHIPSREEFGLLISYLGGSNVAGGKLREQGYSHWAKPTADCGNSNSISSNESGFTGLPGGVLRNEVWGLTWHSEYWTTTNVIPMFEPDEIYTLSLQFCGQSVDFESEFQKWDGVSVRCIKD